MCVCVFFRVIPDPLLLSSSTLLFFLSLSLFVFHRFLFIYLLCSCVRFSVKHLFIFLLPLVQAFKISRSLLTFPANPRRRKLRSAVPRLHTAITFFFFLSHSVLNIDPLAGYLPSTLNLLSNYFGTLVQSWHPTLCKMTPREIHGTQFGLPPSLGQRYSSGALSTNQHEAQVSRRVVIGGEGESERWSQEKRRGGKGSRRRKEKEEGKAANWSLNCRDLIIVNWRSSPCPVWGDGGGGLSKRLSPPWLLTVFK